MTTIRVYKKDNYFELEAIGHAGYAEHGKDIVCAAISTLLQTLALRVTDITTESVYSTLNGYLYLSARGSKCIEAYDVIRTGLNMVSTSYPKHLEIEDCRYPLFRQKYI